METLDVAGEAITVIKGSMALTCLGDDLKAILFDLTRATSPGTEIVILFLMSFFHSHLKYCFFFFFLFLRHSQHA